MLRKGFVTKALLCMQTTWWVLRRIKGQRRASFLFIRAFFKKIVLRFNFCCQHCHISFWYSLMVSAECSFIAPTNCVWGNNSKISRHLILDNFNINLYYCWLIFRKMAIFRKYYEKIVQWWLCLQWIVRKFLRRLLLRIDFCVSKQSWFFQVIVAVSRLIASGMNRSAMYSSLTSVNNYAIGDKGMKVILLRFHDGHMRLRTMNP